MLDEIFHQNTTNFAIIFVIQKPMYIGFFVLHFVEHQFSVEFENHELIVYKLFKNVKKNQYAFMTLQILYNAIKMT